MPARVRGVEDVQRKMANIARRGFPKSLERAVYKFANIEMVEMKRLVPVDTGALKSSGFVEQPVWHGPVLRLTLGFGGPSVDYAIIVHEDLEAFHATGQAKYVEQPWNEAAPFMLQRIIADLQLSGMVQ